VPFNGKITLLDLIRTYNTKTKRAERNNNDNNNNN
jgi:hypothetical protein